MKFTERLLGRGESAVSKICGSVINCLLVLLLVALFGVLIVTNIFALCRVTGDSMNPTLENRQFVLVEKHKAVIKRGDVVVFRKSGEPTQYIKRAACLAGDVFRFAGEGDRVFLYVNGEKKTDDYAMNAWYWESPYAPYIGLKVDVEYTVPAGKLLALGDNRNHSKDSRYDSIGFVDCETELLGRADVFLEMGSFTEWLVEMIYGAPFKAEFKNTI